LGTCQPTAEANLSELRFFEEVATIAAVKAGLLVSPVHRQRPLNAVNCCKSPLKAQHLMQWSFITPEGSPAGDTFEVVPRPADASSHDSYLKPVLHVGICRAK
jgi:hypothetical protein